MKMALTMNPVMMITLMLIGMLIRLLERRTILACIRIGIEDIITMMMMNKPIEMMTLIESSNQLLRELTGLKNKPKK